MVRTRRSTGAGSWYLTQSKYETQSSRGRSEVKKTGKELLKDKQGVGLVLLELVALSVEARFVDEDVGVGGDTGHRTANVISNLEVMNVRRRNV